MQLACSSLSSRARASHSLACAFFPGRINEIYIPLLPRLFFDSKLLALCHHHHHRHNYRSVVVVPRTTARWPLGETANPGRSWSRGPAGLIRDTDRSCYRRVSHPSCCCCRSFLSRARAFYARSLFSRALSSPAYFRERELKTAECRADSI